MGRAATRATRQAGGTDISQRRIVGDTDLAIGVLARGVFPVGITAGFAMSHRLDQAAEAVRQHEATAHP